MPHSPWLVKTDSPGHPRFVPRCGAQRIAYVVKPRNKVLAFAQPDRCSVYDYLLLCQTKQDATDSEVYEACSEIISLMYSLPNIIIGFTGKVCVQHSSVGKGAVLGHAVHLRMANRQAVDDFMVDPVKGKAFQNHIQGITDGRYIELCFEGSVHRDLDNIFRRSDRWGAGFEHVILLSRRSENTKTESGDVSEFTNLLAQVAEAESVGSLQGVAGEVTLPETSARWALQHWGAIPSHIVMCRFNSLEDADAFSKLPPMMAAKQGDERCPVTATLELCFEIEPVEGQGASTHL